MYALGLGNFLNMDLGKGVLSQAELLAHRLPEMPANLVSIIEDIWLTDVVGRYNN